MLAVVSLFVGLAAQAKEVTPKADEANQVVVEQPRAYGYLVGDVLLQKIQLTVDGQPVELVDLPRKDKIGVWLSRRSITYEARTDGTRWLVIDYQIINASKDVDVIALPKLHLATRTPNVFLNVPDWPITVGAITPNAVRNQGALLPLQLDEPAPTIDTGVIRHRLLLAVTGTVLTLALWLSWWRLREWQASRALPFARAKRELRALVDRTSPDAWRVLHRAFDLTAGRSLQPASLFLLFERAPQFVALRADIERFYADSATLFFGGGSPSSSSVALPALCAKLRAIEKRNEH